MKKHIFFITLCFGVTISSFAQWTTNGNNVTIDKNIGIGTTTPTVKLDVNGDVKANALHLRSTNPGAHWLNSNIYYPGHSLVIGSPAGNYAENALDLKPGGSPQGPLPSLITMYLTHSIGNYEKKVQIKTVGNTYFNGGNVGIGTETPTTKLDIIGDIKANSLHLRSTNPGSDWMNSNIYYPGHSLVIGSPAGNYSHNALDLKPGGTSQSMLSTTITMWVAHAIGNYEKKVQIRTAGHTYFNGGYVGIGTDAPKHELDVRGVISAGEVKVQVLAGADYVFNSDYNLKPLSEVEAFVKENKHLPEIPSEKHMQENGLNMNEFQIKLLQKIEELTLYVIELKKENNEIKLQLNDLQK